MVCIRCQKRPAIIFVQRMENGQMKNEGYCLHCAREMHIKPVDDLMKQFGMSDEDMDAMEDRMENMMQEMGDMSNMNPFSMMMGMGQPDQSEEDSDLVPGSSATFPLGVNGGAQNGKNEKKAGKNDKKPPRRKFLDTYCENLTRKAREGKLDDIIGRDREIYRTIQILSRRQKNNPCLIGEAGVGKTAIAEGIAERIAKGQVPAGLQDKEIFLLDLTSLVAGTQFRGQFEQRVKGLLSEVKAAGNVILFIDEIHTITSAGESEGAMNAGNILKPALSRGEIQVIGATTFNEYRKYIEKDQALERRFQPVRVEEPSVADTLAVMGGIKHYYEEHHHVQVPADVLNATVTLSERYITDRYLPDKAIDLMDEAAARARLGMMHGSDDMMQLNREIHQTELDMEHALQEGDIEKARTLKETRENLQASREKLEKKNRRVSKNKVPVVGENEIADVVAGWTKIPVSRLTESEASRLQKLEETLHKRVIGQEEAVSAVSKAVRRGRVGLKDPKRPIGSFLFLGPTGVGKTEVSKALAEAVFGNEESMIRVDMSEYMEKHSVSKMIGSPPGYVGHEDGGQLSEKVRRNPFSVILFDEIEKAHPDVFNILLQVLDDGHITDSQGRKVDFKNTIIIMTSNAGAQSIIEPKKLGFGAKEDEKQDHERMKASVMEEVKRIFKPEFLNRIDETIVFRALNKDDMKKIIGIMVRDLQKRCKEQLQIDLVVREAAKESIVEKAYDRKYGARPLRRKLQDEVEDRLADALIRGEIHTGDRVIVTTKNKEIIVSKDKK